jgi:hypothetical protein
MYEDDTDDGIETRKDGNGAKIRTAPQCQIDKKKF